MLPAPAPTIKPNRPARISDALWSARQKRPAEETTLRNRPARDFPIAVGAVFSAHPKPIEARLLALRRLILDTAKATKGVGALEETLKWDSRAISRRPLRGAGA